MVSARVFMICPALFRRLNCRDAADLPPFYSLFFAISTSPKEIIHINALICGLGSLGNDS